MIGTEERRKLMERMGNDPAYPLIAVLRCLAALLVLVAIAAGPWTFLASSNPGEGIQAAVPARQALAGSAPGDAGRREVPGGDSLPHMPDAPYGTSSGE